MKRFAVVLLVAMLSLVFLFAPAILEARGGHGGGGGRGGSHGGGRSHGGSSGSHHGGTHGGYHGSYHGGYYGGHHGGPGYGGRFYGYVPFLSFGGGFIAGYWSDGYYYTNPYYGVCQRWIPTGGYLTESRQNPDTGAWEEVQVPDGYWEVVPCN